jgi:hypothetical protein
MDLVNSSCVRHERLQRRSHFVAASDHFDVGIAVADAELDVCGHKLCQTRPSREYREPGNIVPSLGTFRRTR